MTLTIEEKAKKFDELQKKEEAANQAAKEAAEGTANSYEKLQKVYEKVADSAESYYKKGSNIKEMMLEYPQIFAAASIQILGVSTAFNDLTNSMGKGVAGIESYHQRHRELVNDISKMGDDDERIKDIMTKSGMSHAQLNKAVAESGGTLKEFALKTLEASRQQQIFNDHILQTAGATGQLGALKDMTKGYENLDEAVAKHLFNLDKFRWSTGLTIEESQKYYTELLKIPGAITMIAHDTVTGVEGTESFGKALVTLSRGAQIPMETLTSQVKSLRDNFNFMTDKDNSGDKALQFLASMAKASNELQMDFATLQKEINNLGGQFKYYGDNSQGFVKSIYDIAAGLEKTGLSAQNAGELAGKFVGHFSELSLAQKSYISQMSGGPGGLRGALEIESMLREGKFEDVFKKVKETMKINLGDMVTLEEAKGSEEAAAKYTMQMQMLKSGPLGGFAKSDAEASRLLDAMVKSEKEPSKLQEAADSMKDYHKDGEKRQKQNATFYSDMRSGMESMQLHAQVIAYNTTQLLSGNKPGGKTLFGDVSADTEKTMEEYKRTRMLFQKQMGEGQMGRRPEQSHGVTQNESFRTLIDGGASLLGEIGDIGKKMLQGSVAESILSVAKDKRVSVESVLKDQGKLFGEVREAAEKQLKSLEKQKSDLRAKDVLADTSSIDKAIAKQQLILDSSKDSIQKAITQMQKEAESQASDTRRKAVQTTAKAGAEAKTSTTLTKSPDGVRPGRDQGHDFTLHSANLHTFCHGCQEKISAALNPVSPQQNAADPRTH